MSQLAVAICSRNLQGNVDSAGKTGGTCGGGSRAGTGACCGGSSGAELRSALRSHIYATLINGHIFTQLRVT